MADGGRRTPDRGRAVKASKREAGAKGGQTTAQRYGADHMREVGRLGMIARAERDYGGDVGAMMRDLRARIRQPAEYDPKLRCYVKRAGEP